MRRTFWVSITLGLAAFLVLPMPGLSAPLSSRIDETRGKVQKKRQKEGVLSETISGFEGKIDRLQGQIGGLQQRQNRLQGQLNLKRSEVIALNARLERARERLSRLRGELAKSETALAGRLVELYKADEPDVLTVVLESDGFADLLERTEFMERVSEQDGRIVTRVRDLKGQVTRQAVELSQLEDRARAAAQTIEVRRNQIRDAKGGMAATRNDLASARDERSTSLSRLRSSRVRLEGNLDELVAEQAQVQAALRAAARSATPAAPPTGGAIPPLSGGDVRGGSGRLIFPVNGPVVSPFGPRWGRLHAGIDIAVPAGTPIRAADSGRVVLLGVTGGYGNYTCIQHGNSLSTCYAHQSRYATSNGASVKQGQVIGYVGCTGSCFGDHVHFETRVNGSPVNPLGYL